MSNFELRLRVNFPREIVFVQPPAPTSPTSGPSVATDLGKLIFFFDDWDLPIHNLPGDPAVGVDSFFVHFVPEKLPSSVEDAFDSRLSYFAGALFWNEDLPHLKELRDKHSIGKGCESDEERQEAWLELQRHRADMLNTSAKLCAELFAISDAGQYFGEVGRVITDTVQRFLTVLRIEFGQYLLPDRPPIRWQGDHWFLSDGTVREVSEAFLGRLFASSKLTPDFGVFPAITERDWPSIADRIQTHTAPELSEILLATALGQCDPELGNPRLGIIEAVVALEIEIKKLMDITLSRYGIGKNAIDRIVRETPLADLVTVWIRREITGTDWATDKELYERCAIAIHERNALVHRERRGISSERAKGHILALSRLVEKARLIRQQGAK